jgi:acetyl-CoA C-acetyltransferase
MDTGAEVFIVGACRTPIGSLNGGLSSLPGHELGAVALSEAMKRAKLSPNDVSEVLMGQILTAGTGMNPARQASMKAGIPKEVPSAVINMLCGSGLRSVAMAVQAIKCGDASVIVAGGQESMSSVRASV